MNELFINLIIIIVIVVLFLAYILIAYFYNSYINYKSDVKTNFNETTSYINTTTNKIDNNINTKTNAVSAKVDAVDIKYKDINLDLSNRLTSNKLSIDIINNNITSNTSNLRSFDSGVKQFIEFRDNNNNINDTLFNYRFSAVPNLSMNLIRKVSAISGMTIKTDGDINKFRICDDKIGESNCIDLRVYNGNFDIMPSAIKDNNISNINFYNKNNNVMAKMDMLNNNIYLGGGGENAGLFINESNVYLKNFNLIDPNTKYLDKKVIYDKVLRGTNQTFNTYNYSFDDISRNTSNFVTGIYTIIRGTGTPPTNNTIILNFKSSYNIPIGKDITFDIHEFSNTTSDIIINVVDVETSPGLLLASVKLNTNKIIIKTNSMIIASVNQRIKITNANFGTTISSPYLSNLIMTKI